MAKKPEKPAPTGPSDHDLDNMLALASAFKPPTLPLKQAQRLSEQIRKKNGFEPPQTGKGWKPTMTVLEKIRQLAQTGLSIKRIAPVLGMWPTTLARRMDRYPELRAAYELGKAGGCAKVAQGLYDNATKEGNVTAQALYLKEHDNWGNKQELKVSGDVNVKTAWTVNVVASDGSGGRGEQTSTITVSPDAVTVDEQGDDPAEQAITQGEPRYEQAAKGNEADFGEDMAAMMNERAATRWR